MNTPIFPSAEEAQHNTKNAQSFDFLCGHEIFVCFKAVNQASTAGYESVIVQVLPLYILNCQAALESKGYVTTGISDDAIQVEWSPAILRRASFQIIAGGSNE